MTTNAAHGADDSNAQNTVEQVKDKVGDAASRARDLAISPADSKAVALPVYGAAGVAVALTAWLWRRRSRRNANPWRAAAKDAGAHVKTVRRQAKAGVKAARKRSREQAAARLAAARSQARKAKARAKSWT
jgi:hypothetical protein